MEPALALDSSVCEVDDGLPSRLVGVAPPVTDADG